MITSKVVLDSVSSEGIRLTTLELEYPRFIHSEFMTHRVFSRNASSSRAIPIEKQARMVAENPAMPIHWGKNQKGMQANEEIDAEQRKEAKQVWREARLNAILTSEHLSRLGVHKQIVNRILEPWQHIKVVCTSTDYANFLTLRNHKDAQPEMQELAKQIAKSLQQSTPNVVEYGHWHLPYITQEEQETKPIDELLESSAARCARVSYQTHDKKNPTRKEDHDLYNRLVGSIPRHSSPLEHQATPDKLRGLMWANSRMHGNFYGWKQHRKIMEGM